MNSLLFELSSPLGLFNLRYPLLIWHTTMNRTCTDLNTSYGIGAHIKSEGPHSIRTAEPNSGGCGCPPHLWLLQLLQLRDRRSPSSAAVPCAVPSLLLRRSLLLRLAGDAPPTDLALPRWCRAVGVVVAWVADSLLDAAVISSAECVSQVAQRCLSWRHEQELLQLLALLDGEPPPLALLQGEPTPPPPLALLKWEPTQIHE